MKHLWRHDHVHPEGIVVLRHRDAVLDEALEVNELGVLEEQVPRVVCQRLAATFPNAKGCLHCSAHDPRAEALVVVEDMLVGEVLVLAEGHGAVVWVGREHSGFEVWHSP